MDDPIPPLDPVAVRVLGALVEKQLTTPDYYPLTLNALVNACNQLSNREPVMDLDETAVLRAIGVLREHRLATLFTGAESRVAKYKHTLTDALLLTPGEVALLCVLFLRGPQTLGELRPRTERIFRFDTLPETEAALAVLAERQPQPLVAKLPRAPGTKESRYAHLFGGPVEVVDSRSAPAPAALIASPLAPVPAAADRLARLETEAVALRAELAELKAEFARFRAQCD
ncbi:MAG: hypothetical protein B9S34_04990 [Opitutia bacterium Tous-C1TDCM]|nr:MAG: hypothetical protein B9S34_04990 [Opitutae bacterium Tous-C1TDCM]